MLRGDRAIVQPQAHAANGVELAQAKQELRRLLDISQQGRPEPNSEAGLDDTKEDRRPKLRRKRSQGKGDV